MENLRVEEIKLGLILTEKNKYLLYKQDYRKDVTYLLHIIEKMERVLNERNKEQEPIESNIVDFIT